MGGGEKFKTLELIATGGTAVLYKAVQTSLDRIVAVKKLHQHLTSDETFTRRFVLEAKAAASLDHENIVHVIDFGIINGAYHIIMDFVEGASLKEIIERKKTIPADMALAIAYQACRGLEHAHNRGIIHRDIKPGNLLLTRYGRVKITDFGLAKLTYASTKNTASDSILGTPLYMSPEQAYGESVDHRSDLFSLGTVLYEMVTGTQPFLSDNYMGVIQNIINSRIPPPSQLNEQVPLEVEKIIFKALNRNRDKRFQSAGEFRQAIEECMGMDRLKRAEEMLPALLENMTTTAVLESPLGRKLTQRRRMKGAAAALLAAGAVLLAFHFDILVSVLKGPGGDAPLPGMAEIQQGSLVPEADPFVDGSLPGIDSTASELESPIPTDSTPAPTTPADSSAVATAGSDTSAARRESALDRENQTAATAAAETAASQREEEEKPPQPTIKDQKVAIGWLHISAEPWAELYVDGKYRGDVPPSIKLTLPAGIHRIECRNALYRPYREEVVIVRGELSRRSIVLKKLTGKIELVTQAGAQLYVDGKLQGVTPLHAPLEVGVGRHQLTLKKRGFNVWNSEVTVEADHTIRLRITLSPRF